MATFTHDSTYPHPREEVFAWHERPGAFTRLSAPGQIRAGAEPDVGLQPGTRQTFSLLVPGTLGKVGPTWVAEHTAYEVGERFEDVMVRGPLKSWRHRHLFSDNATGDTLIRDATPAEVRAVMAHEIGHYVLNHVYELLLEFGLVIAIGFAFVNGTFAAVARRGGERWGISDIGDVGGMPLLFALFSVYMLVMTPVTNTIIRSNEAEADAYGLALAREPDGFAAVSMKLGAYRKLDPGPVERFVFHDHPTGRDRVTMAMNFKAAELAAGATDIDPSMAPLVPEVERYVAKREADRTAKAGE